MSPLRVLLIFSSAEIGGAERTLTRMVSVAADTNIRYRLATVGEGSTWANWARDLGLAPVGYPVFRGTRLGLPEIARLVRDSRSWKPHIIYVIGMRCAILVRLLRPLLPRTLVVHGIRSSFPRGTQLARRMGISERLFGWLTDHYVANSETGAETLAQITRVPRRKITVIRNGVQLSPVTTIGVRERPFRVVVVANLNRYKGHIEFLDVIEHVRRVVPDVEVLFIGRDDSGGQVMREVERRGLAGIVRALGFVDTPETHVATARVLALPSREIEGCPTAVLEALTVGVPVVAYAVGGLPEIVENGKTGILVNWGGSEAFAAALVRLLTDTELNVRYSDAALHMAAKKFTLAECAAKHGMLWRQLTQSADTAENA